MKKNTHQLTSCLARRRGGRIFLLGFAVVLFSFSALAEMRIWEKKSGERFVAEYVREISGRVTLKTPDKKPMFIKVEDLSDSDVRYIRTFALLPEIQLLVRKKEKPKERNYEFVRPNDFIDVLTLDVQVKKKGRTPFYGKLKLEVYIVGEDFDAPLHVLEAKGGSPVSFTEENEGLYDFSISTDIRHYLEYNETQMRGSKYEGYLVVVLDPQGKTMATKTNLSWLKDEKIDAFRALRVGSFFDDKCRNRSVPRPDYYSARFEW